MTTSIDQILEVIEGAQDQFDRANRERAAFLAQVAQAFALQQIAGSLARIETAVSQSAVDQAMRYKETDAISRHNSTLLARIMDNLATLAGTVREYEGDAMFRIRHYD